jgi:hypothetical protein
MRKIIYTLLISSAVALLFSCKGEEEIFEDVSKLSGMEKVNRLIEINKKFPHKTENYVKDLDVPYSYIDKDKPFKALEFIRGNKYDEAVESLLNGKRIDRYVEKENLDIDKVIRMASSRAEDKKPIIKRLEKKYSSWYFHSDHKKKLLNSLSLLCDRKHECIELGKDFVTFVEENFVSIKDPNNLFVDVNLSKIYKDSSKWILVGMARNLKGEGRTFLSFSVPKNNISHALTRAYKNGNRSFVASVLEIEDRLINTKIMKEAAKRGDIGIISEYSPWDERNKGSFEEVILSLIKRKEFKKISNIRKVFENEEHFDFKRFDGSITLRETSHLDGLRREVYLYENLTRALIVEVSSPERGKRNVKIFSSSSNNQKSILDRRVINYKEVESEEWHNVERRYKIKVSREETKYIYSTKLSMDSGIMGDEYIDGETKTLDADTLVSRHKHSL